MTKTTTAAVTVTLLLLASTACAQSRILTPELRAKIPALVTAGEPHASYSVWRRAPDKDPAWIANAPWHAHYYTYLATGDLESLERSKIALRPAWPKHDIDPEPEIPGGTHNALRQEGVDACIRYQVLKPHLSAEQRIEWERRLRVMGDAMLDARIGDMDECLSYYAAFRLLDRDLGTGYCAQRPDLETYVRQVFSAEAVAGGFFDASSEYHVNNCNLWLLAGAALDKDLPGFDNWAKEAAKFFSRSVSYDGATAESHGDLQGSREWRDYLMTHYRVGVLWSLHALGYDEDGACARLAARLLPPRVGEPYSLYPAGQHTWAFLFLDPTDMPLAGGQPFVGLHDVPGKGFALYHGPRTFAEVDLRTMALDDHDYDGAWASAKLYSDGEWILECPGGYGINDNCWLNHNSFALKGMGWPQQAKRVYHGAVATPTGFRSGGYWEGPSQQWYHGADPPTEGSPSDWNGCRVDAAIALSDNTLTLEFTWTSPGHTFPSWTDGMPVAQLPIHTRCEPQPVTGGYQWTLPSGRVVRVLCEGGTASVQPAGTWHRIVFASDKLAGTMRVVVNAAPAVAPVVQHSGHAWTLGTEGNGGRQLLRDGEHAGGGYGVLYRVGTDDKLHVRNSFGQWYAWDGAWRAEATEPADKPAPPAEPTLPVLLPSRVELRRFSDRIERVEVFPLVP